MTKRTEGNEPDVWEQELAGDSAVRTLFVLTRRRFRELARTDGLSQQQLAERMGLTRSQVSRWFSNPSNMTLRSAAKLLMAMGRKLELGVSDPFAMISKRGLENGRAIGRPAEATKVVRLRSAGPATAQFAMAAASKKSGHAAGADGQAAERQIGEAKGPAGTVVFSGWKSAVVVMLPDQAEAGTIRLQGRKFDLLPTPAGSFYVAGLSLADARIFVEDNKQNSEEFPVEWM